MALVNKEDPNHQIRFNIPHEEGEWMVFADLDWSDLEDAKDAEVERIMMKSASMPNLSELIEKAGENTQNKEAVKKDPLSELHIGTLLEKAIIDWSYAEKPPKNFISVLDKKTKDWALDIIVQRNIVTEEEGEATART